MARQVVVAAVIAACAGLAACTRVVDPQTIEDAQTAVRVKTALVNDAEIGPRPIEVRVVNGVARLTGVVHSDAEARRAVELAQRVTGVVDVRSELEVRAPAAPRSTTPNPAAPPAGSPPPESGDDGFDPDDFDLDAAAAPGWLAAGVAAGARLPPDSSLRSSWTLGPLIRLGAGSGLGFTVGFSWYQADLLDPAGDERTAGKLRIRPVMGGVGYTVREGRQAISVSLVGGVAINSFAIDDPGLGGRVAVAVDNSLALRPGVSVWYDVGRRWAVHLFGGYIITRPRVTYLEDGRLDKRALRGDTAIVNAGLAYKIF